MKKGLISTIVLTVAFVAPAFALAATYQYVNIQGNLASVNADDASQALALATDIDPHSGVALVDPTIITTTTSGPVGTYIGTAGAANTSGTAMGLVLSSDGTADLATSYESGQAPTVETGSWTVSANNQVTLILTGSSSQMYSPNHVIVFTETGTGLVATQYDQTMYGSNGLSFTKE